MNQTRLNSAIIKQTTDNLFMYIVIHKLCFCKCFFKALCLLLAYTFRGMTNIDLEIKMKKKRTSQVQNYSHKFRQRALKN